MQTIHVSAVMPYSVHMSSQKHPGSIIVIGLIFSNLLISSTTADVGYSHSITPENKSKYEFTNGTVRYCLPILSPSFCGEGREIKPCLRDGERDRCEPCQEGQANLDRTTSDFQTPCYTFSCPENSVQVDKRPDNGCNLPCVCDQTAGYVQDDACMCKHVEFECQTDTYLNAEIQTDKCTACPTGTHKPGRGYGPCIPLTSTQKKPTLSKTSTQPPKNATKSRENVPDSVEVVLGTNQEDTVNEEVKNTANGEVDDKPKLAHGQSVIITTTVVGIVLLGIILVLVVFLVQKSRGQRARDVEGGSQMNQERSSLVRNDVIPGRQDPPPPYSPPSSGPDPVIWNPPTLPSNPTTDPSGVSGTDADQVQPKTLFSADVDQVTSTGEEGETREDTSGEETGTPDSETNLLKQDRRDVQ